MEENLTKKERRLLAKEEKQKERIKNQTFGKVKNYIIIAIVILTLGFLGYKFYKYIQTPTYTATNDIFTVNQSDWIEGNKDAKTTLIEYSDFECPACKNFSDLINKLSQDYSNNLRIVYRHFPLDTIHKNAFPAARAAEAAGKQGKFWEMHDLLFAKQDDWANSSKIKEVFVGYAKDLSLDQDKFSLDYDSKEVEDKVSKDQAGAYQLRINSPPTFYLDGVRVGDIRGYDDLKSLIEKEIAKNNG